MPSTHTHTFAIAAHMPMGLPFADGYVPMILVRACTTCVTAECLHGTSTTHKEELRFCGWESWGAGPKPLKEGRYFTRWEKRS